MENRHECSVEPPNDTALRGLPVICQSMIRAGSPQQLGTTLDIEHSARSVTLRRSRLWLGLQRLNRLAVHERPTILHLDEHVAKLALPDVSQHALRCQGQVGLRAGFSSSEDFWK